MMTNEYEYVADNWKRHDTQDHEANAAFYDEVAQTKAAKPFEYPATNHLALAQRHMEDYERRINADNFRGDMLDRQVWEDRAYKLAMLNANYAQAEAATRQAEVMESLLEFVADFVGNTNITDALLQWGYRQKAG
jgi:hypothetical protein